MTKTPISSFCVSPGHRKPAATSDEVQGLRRCCVQPCFHCSGLKLVSTRGRSFKSPEMTFFFFLSKTNALLNMPGRAGRVSKGYCYRLVTRRFWNKEIPDHMVPDMLVSVFFSCGCSHHLCTFNFNAGKTKPLMLCVPPLPLSLLHWPPSC